MGRACVGATVAVVVPVVFKDEGVVTILSADGKNDIAGEDITAEESDGITLAVVAGVLEGFDGGLWGGVGSGGVLGLG